MAGFSKVHLVLELENPWNLNKDFPQGMGGTSEIGVQRWRALTHQPHQIRTLWCCSMNMDRKETNLYVKNMLLFILCQHELKNELTLQILPQSCIDIHFNYGVIPENIHTIPQMASWILRVRGVSLTGILKVLAGECSLEFQTSVWEGGGSYG